jgi:hypothetical protein
MRAVLALTITMLLAIPSLARAQEPVPTATPAASPSPLPWPAKPIRPAPSVDPSGLAEPTYLRQHPAPASLTPLVERMTQFWATSEDRSLRPVGALDIASLCPQGVTVWQAPTLGEAWGAGWHHVRPDGTMSCAAWLSDSLIAALSPPDRHLNGPDWETAHDQAVSACTAGTHEFGHALGLPHSPTGVMAGEGSVPSRPGAWAPFFCRAWANKSLRPYRARSARRPKHYAWVR